VNKKHQWGIAGVIAGILFVALTGAGQKLAQKL